MNSLVPDANEPNLCIRMACDEPVSSSEHIIGNFEVACVDVNGHYLSEIPGFDLRADLLLVDFRSTPGVFLF